MSERRALFRAVCENPDNDLPRLVLADWLEEHDEPDYADFIRAQCEFEKLSHTDPAFIRLMAQKYHLLKCEEWENHETSFSGLQWIKNINWVEHEGPRRWSLFPDYYRRGFRWRIFDANVADFLSQAQEIFRSAPIGAVGFNAINPSELVELIHSPWFERLTCLHIGTDRDPLRDTYQAARNAFNLLATAKNSRIEELSISYGVWSDVVLEVLANSPLLRRLKCLTLGSGFMSYRHIEMMRKLSDVPGLVHLDRLVLSIQYAVVSDSLRSCARSVFKCVSELVLGGKNTQGDHGDLRFMVEEGPFPNLLWLDVNGWNLGDFGLVLLSEPRNFPNLKVLILRRTQLNDESASRFLQSSLAQQLSFLDLSDNDSLGPKTVNMLLSTSFPNLELLLISPKNIGMVLYNQLREKFGYRVPNVIGYHSRFNRNP